MKVDQAINNIAKDFNQSKFGYKNTLEGFMSNPVVETTMSEFQKFKEELTDENTKVPVQKGITSFDQKLSMNPIKSSIVSCSINSYNALWQCIDQHEINICPEFIKLSAKQRFQLIKKSGKCINSFQAGHTSTVCESQKCKTCNKPHNDLLHWVKNSTIDSGLQRTPTRQHVFLVTVILFVRGKNGNQIKVRALLDSGAQVNTMSNELLQKIGLQANNVSMTIEGVGGCKI